MNDITKADKVYVSTSKNGDYVSAFDDGDSVAFIRADLVPQWMPIETAPKDGEWVMGYFPNLGVVQMIWCNYRPGLVDHWMRFGKLTPMDPTHWMPLPTPPPAT